MLFIFLVFLIFLSGVIFARLLGIKNNIELIGVGGILGPVSFTYLQFIAYYLFDVHMNISNTIPLLLVMFLFFLLLLLCSKKKISFLTEIINQIKQIHTFSPVQKSMVLVLSIIIGSTFINNLVWPITDWDAKTLYDFRAQVIFQNNGDFVEPITESYYLEYPPFTSLLHLLAYNSGIVQVKIWYSVLLLFSTIVFYSLLRKNQSRTVALLGSIFFVFSPKILEHSQMAYTNLPYAVYFSFGMIYIGEWLHKRREAYLWLGCVLVGFSTWVRLMEPFWIVAVLLLLIGIAVIKNKTYSIKILIGAAVILFIKYPWIHFSNSFGVASSLDSGILNKTSETVASINFQSSVSRLLEVIHYVWSNIFKQYFVFLILVVLSFQNHWNKKKLSSFGWHFLYLLLISALLIAGTFIFSMSYPFWDAIPDSATRMSIFFSILLPYVIFNSNLLAYTKKR